MPWQYFQGRQEAGQIDAYAEGLCCFRGGRADTIDNMTFTPKAGVLSTDSVNGYFVDKRFCEK